MPAAKTKTAAKKPASKKPSPTQAATDGIKKTTAAAKKKATIPKSSSAKAKATRAIPADREQKLAEQALSYVDQAAAVLRDRIRDGATQTAKGRLAAKKRANSLLTRANDNLTKAIDTGTTSLQKLLGKL